MNKLFYFLLFNLANAFDICVVGASSGLGRELIYQSLNNNKKVLGLTNNPQNVCIPYRGKGLTELNFNKKKILNNHLTLDNYENSKKYLFDNIIFTTNGQPFSKDYSLNITKNIMENTKLFHNKALLNLNKIVLISAYGVGDSLEKSNFGIKVMNNWYLKDVYYNKNQQESYLNKFIEASNIDLEIFRPKVLSYGENLINAKSRQELASEIINLVF